MPTKPKVPGVGKGGNQPFKIDRDVLHELLFRRADRMGRLKLNVKAMAEKELGCNYAALDKIMMELIAQGRMRPMNPTRKGPKTYLIKEPGKWRAEQ